MPKADKSKKNGSSRKGDTVKKGRPLVKSSDVEGTVYGQVTRSLGDCNFMVYCFDAKERLCHIRKSIKKTERAEVDTIVLVGIRDFQEDKGDIVYIYTKDQTADLKRMNEIPSKVSTGMDGSDEEDDMESDIIFDQI